MKEHFRTRPRSMLDVLREQEKGRIGVGIGSLGNLVSLGGSPTRESRQSTRPWKI